MRPAPDRIMPGGGKIVAAFEHSGPARALVHHLKYRGLTGFVDAAAAIIAPRLPKVVLVPVPRAVSRHLHYGVDPARLLAKALARRLGTEVHAALAPPFHSPRRAGSDHRRPAHRFRLRRAVDGPVLLVDDVVTSGATLGSAAAAIGLDLVAGAAAANAVPEMRSLR